MGNPVSIGMNASKVERQPLADLVETSASLYAQAVRTHEKVTRTVELIRGPEPCSPSTENDKPFSMAETCRSNMEQATRLLSSIEAQIERL